MIISAEIASKVTTMQQTATHLDLKFAKQMKMKILCFHIR
jgi:hypothetical protein